METLAEMAANTSLNPDVPIGPPVSFGVGRYGKSS
jgi:hypothetical protein